MDHVRFGVIGVGNMGMYHLGYFHAIENARVVAISDADPKRLDVATGKFANLQRFDRNEDLLASGLIDAVLVATPHYQHPDITIAAFEKGLHVLCEKPAAVTVKEARRMNDAAGYDSISRGGADHIALAIGKR